MNKALEYFARKTITEQLALCDEGCRTKFKRIFGKTSMPLEEVIANIPVEKLSRVMDLVERTLG